MYIYDSTTYNHTCTVDSPRTRSISSAYMYTSFVFNSCIFQKHRNAFSPCTLCYKPMYRKEIAENVSWSRSRVNCQSSTEFEQRTGRSGITYYYHKDYTLNCNVCGHERRRHAAGSSPRAIINSTWWLCVSLNRSIDGHDNVLLRDGRLDSDRSPV